MQETITQLPILGETITNIERTKVYSGDRLDFTAISGLIYAMYHDQDCCEDVSIKQIDGDLDDLLNSPLIRAECRTKRMSLEECRIDTSELWTFYEFATIKGSVTITWFGSSNGYYSEEVTFRATNIN